MSELLSFLTTPLGKLYVASTNNSGPRPTHSKKNQYGLEHVDQVSRSWPEFTCTNIKQTFAHILDTPTRSYTPQPPVHARSIIHSEQDFVEHFRHHFEETINYALDLTFSAPVLIVIRDFVASIEGNPGLSQDLIRALPWKDVRRILKDQYHWNRTKSDDLKDIRHHLMGYFGVQPRSRDKDEIEANRRVATQEIGEQDVCYLAATALKNTLSQYFIPEILAKHVSERNTTPMLTVVGLLPVDVKVKHIIPWIGHNASADHLHELIGGDKFGDEEIKVLLNFLPLKIRAFTNDNMPPQHALDVTFARLPSPLERYRHFGGKEKLSDIRIVPTGGITLHEQLNPDLASSVRQTPHSSVLPGEFKISKNWKPEWDTSSDHEERKAFWHAISQVQCYTYQYRVRYGYIISDAGLRCFRRVAKKGKSGETSKHGHVELSPPIRWDDSRQQLTIMLAVWYLHMLAAEEGNSLPNELWVEDRFNNTKLVFNQGRSFIDDPSSGHRYPGLPNPGSSRGRNNFLG